jgi:hypothetical protein
VLRYQSENFNWTFKYNLFLNREAFEESPMLLSSRFRDQNTMTNFSVKIDSRPRTF